MKQRVMSLVVKEKETTLFEKSPASPQDLMAALTLYDRDEFDVLVSVKPVDLTPETK